MKYFVMMIYKKKRWEALGGTSHNLCKISWNNIHVSCIWYIFVQYIQSTWSASDLVSSTVCKKFLLQGNSLCKHACLLSGVYSYIWFDMMIRKEFAYIYRTLNSLQNKYICVYWIVSHRYFKKHAPETLQIYRYWSWP